MSRQKPQSPQEYWSEWLVDAVATSTQDRRFLRDNEEHDEALCEALLLNGRKAIDNACRANETKLREAAQNLLDTLYGHLLVTGGSPLLLNYVTALERVLEDLDK